MGNGYQVEELAARVLRRQRDPQTKTWLSPLGRWREARYRRALATAPVDALLAALTTERDRNDKATTA
jgi:hypothetical protein